MQGLTHADLAGILPRDADARRDTLLEAHWIDRPAKPTGRPAPAPRPLETDDAMPAAEDLPF